MQTVSIAKKFAAEQLAHVRLFAKWHDRVEMSKCETKFFTFVLDEASENMEFN